MIGRELQDTGDKKWETITWRCSNWRLGEGINRKRGGEGVKTNTKVV